MATLIITMKTDGELSGFPFRKDEYGDWSQWVDGEVAARDTVRVEILLGDRDDTDAAQEQYLNTHPDVLSYEVR